MPLSLCRGYAHHDSCHTAFITCDYAYFKRFVDGATGNALDPGAVEKSIEMISELERLGDIGDLMTIFMGKPT